jgi:shikimate dehydrogenase
VTLPHKEHALQWLAATGGACSEVARACGAVNTLTRDAAGRWHGDNTDVAGVRAALALHAPLAGDGLRGLRVLILGAGGAARAAVLAVQSAGGAATLCNRTAARAAQAAQELRCAALAWEQRAALANFDVLINCTSVGLWPAPDASPMPDDALAPPLVVLDTIYRPRATRLLQAAEARGCVVLSGSEMFIGQAAAQFETWHGGHATTLSTMRAALQE